MKGAKCTVFQFSDSAPQDIGEARALFKKLHGMLGTDQKNVVPQRVYLYPIKYIKANPLMALLKVTPERLCHGVMNEQQNENECGEASDVIWSKKDIRIVVHISNVCVTNQPTDALLAMDWVRWLIGDFGENFHLCYMAETI